MSALCAMRFNVKNSVSGITTKFSTMYAHKKIIGRPMWLVANNRLDVLIHYEAASRTLNSTVKDLKIKLSQLCKQICSDYENASHEHKMGTRYKITENKVLPTIIITFADVSGILNQRG